jgi:hypothetical protein
MDQSNIDVEVELPKTAPALKNFMICKSCGAVLGHWDRKGKALYLFMYAHPPRGCSAIVDGRKVYAHILAGDIVCRCCGEEQEVTLPRPWEMK